MASKTDPSSVVVDTLTQSYTHAHRNPAAVLNGRVQHRIGRSCQVKILLIVATHSTRVTPLDVAPPRLTC